MRTFFLGCIVLACALSMVSCSKESSPTGPGDNNGSVVGVVTREPTSDVTLIGVQVALIGTSFSSYTDSTGAFVIGDVPAGTYTIIASKGEFEGFSEDVQVIAGKTTDVGEIKLSEAILPRVVWTFPTDGQIGGLRSFPIPGTELTGTVLSNAGLQLKFNKVMDTKSVEEAIVLKESGASSETQMKFNLGSYGGDLICVCPLEQFLIGREYSLEIGTGAKDIGGKNLTAPLSISFVPEPYLEVEYTFPDSGATDVSTYSSILVYFNSAMDEESVKEAFSISPETAGEILLDPCGTEQDKLLYFFSSGGLLPDTLYTVTIGTGAKDIHGNYLPEAYSFSLTTSETTESLCPNFWAWDQFFDSSGNWISPSETIISADSTITIVGEITIWDDVEILLDDVGTVTVTVNDREVLTLPIRKNHYSGKIPLENGRNDVRVAVEAAGWGLREETYTFYYYNISSRPKVLITLKWDTGSYNRYADLDLHLIGPDGTDCYYGNPNPDWGVTGEKSDDPLLVVDALFTASGTEIIQLTDPPAGEYVVKVHFYDGYTVTEKVYPWVTVEIEGDKETYRPPSKMVEDEEWIVTSFTIEGLGKVARRVTDIRPLAKALLPAKRAMQSNR